MAMHVSPPLSFTATHSMPLSSFLRNKPTLPIFACVLHLHQTNYSNFQALSRRGRNGYKDFSGNNILDQIEELRKSLNASTEKTSTSKNPILNRVTKGFPVSLPDSECCSVDKAFASMVFMIGELQSHALCVKEHLTREDLAGIVTKMHREIVTSLVWLFQQVFAQTPTLMVCVMILMANFTVHSMTRNAAAYRRSVAAVVGSEKRRKEALPTWERVVSRKEVSAWSSLMEDAMSLREHQMGDFGLEKEKARPYVPPLTMEEEVEEFLKTDLIYEMGLARDPDNALLLANYAQFLYIDRAEECYKKAIMGEPPDPDALSSYAEFLWKVKKDLLEAEEKYQQALEIDPNNFHLASKYAHFLWKTAGIETFIVPHQRDGDNWDTQ